MTPIIELSELLNRQLAMIRRAAASRIDPLEQDKLSRVADRLEFRTVVSGPETLRIALDTMDDAAMVLGSGLRYAKGAMISACFAAEAVESWSRDKDWALQCIKDSDRAREWFLKTLHEVPA